jgi:hypothetical protein
VLSDLNKVLLVQSDTFEKRVPLCLLPAVRRPSSLAEVLNLGFLVRLREKSGWIKGRSRNIGL